MRVIFKKILYLSVIFLCVSCDKFMENYYPNIGESGCVFLENNSSITCGAGYKYLNKHYLSKQDLSSGMIPSSINLYYYNDNFVLVEQYSRTGDNFCDIDPNFGYWLVVKSDKLIYGPLNREEMYNLRDSLNVGTFLGYGGNPIDMYCNLQ